MPQEVVVRWSESVDPKTLAHQPEPGEVLPRTERRGAVVQFVGMMEQVRSGFFETVFYAIILDETGSQLLAKKFTDIRVVRPTKKESS